MVRLGDSSCVFCLQEMLGAGGGQAAVCSSEGTEDSFTLSERVADAKCCPDLEWLCSSASSLGGPRRRTQLYGEKTARIMRQ